MIKCPHCGRDIDETGKPVIKWYFSDPWVVIALLCFGPFALRVVWNNPRYKPQTKWIITVIIIVVTIAITVKLYYLILTVMQQLQMGISG